jgi:hypothetical protein
MEEPPPSDVPVSPPGANVPAVTEAPVPADTPAAWAKGDIDRAVSLDIIPSDMLNQYAANISREEFSRVLAKVFKVSLSNKLASGEIVYDDTLRPFGDTDNPDVGWLNSMGIVKGVAEGVFNPSGAITRQEAAVMLKRAALALGVSDMSTQTNFADQDQAAEWARDSIGFVVAKGIMNGTGENVFSPVGMYTRQQSYVTMLRLYNAAANVAIPV